MVDVVQEQRPKRLLVPPSSPVGCQDPEYLCGMVCAAWRALAAACSARLAWAINVSSPDRAWRLQMHCPDSVTGAKKALVGSLHSGHVVAQKSGK